EWQTMRDGWCHGDLAVAIALVHAGAAAGENAWIARAVAIEADEPDPATDAPGSLAGGLCHGIAGRAHLLSRLAVATGDAVIAQRARRAVASTLQRIADPSLPPEVLIGSAGVALVLDAAVSTRDPGWDRAWLC